MSHAFARSYSSICSCAFLAPWYVTKAPEAETYLYSPRKWSSFDLPTYPYTTPRAHTVTGSARQQNSGALTFDVGALGAVCKIFDEPGDATMTAQLSLPLADDPVDLRLEVSVRLALLSR